MGKLEKMLQEIDTIHNAYVGVESKRSYLNGEFTAEELKQIAEAMELLGQAELYGFGKGE
jgi:hypothetical protein